MAERPLAICRDGRLCLDDGGRYVPVERIAVVLMRETFLQATKESGMDRPLSARYAAECQSALTEYEKQRETASAKTD